MKPWVVISIDGYSGSAMLLAVKARSKKAAENKARRYDPGEKEDHFVAFSFKRYHAVALSAAAFQVEWDKRLKEQTAV